MTDKTVTVYGASDDLVEIDGAIREEFNPTKSGVGGLLVFSDGTVLHIRYGDLESIEDGGWEVRTFRHGTAAYTFHRPAGNEYSERVTLTGDIAWVVWVDGAELPEHDGEHQVQFEAAR